MLAQTPISAKVGRARKDRVATAIAAAADAGVRWRWRGAELVWDGLDGLVPADRTLLDELRPEIEQRLADPAETDPEWILDTLGIECELIVDPARAAAVIAELAPVVGLDTETMPRLEHAPAPTWLAVTKGGARAVHQPQPKDRTALDPRRAGIRLLQVYDPKCRTSFLFEWQTLVDHDLVHQLLARQVVIHNALFDLSMLLAAGVEPPDVIDTTQLAAIALPPDNSSYGGEGEPQLIRLKYVADQVLGLDLAKSLQASDWSAPNLTDGQLAYAAADPAVCYLAGRAMRQQLSERELVAFRLANAAVPVIARMAMRGLPFDPAVHAETIRTWEHGYAAERERFREHTSLEVPVGAPAIRAWLGTRLPQEALEAWPKTDTGLLKTGAEEIKRLAQDHPEVRPLLAVQKMEKRLSTFGTTLLERVSPVTGRLHGDYALPTVTGRLTCRKPNLQQLPSDARAAVRAGPGKVLLSADYGQIELRILAEFAGEQVMRTAFAAGKDIHMVTAARFAPDIERLPKEQQKLPRSKAKAVNYGLPYGMGPSTLRRKAWKDYDLDLRLEEVVEIRDGWFDTYPAVKPHQHEEHNHRFDAVWSVAGRPRRAIWQQEIRDRQTGELLHPAGELKYNDCCNYAVQSSASDLLLGAMVRVDKALPDTIVASVHDELLLEVPGDKADQYAETLKEQMLAAFVHWFPGAPTTGVVKVKTVTSWAEAK